MESNSELGGPPIQAHGHALRGKPARKASPFLTFILDLSLLLLVGSIAILTLNLDPIPSLATAWFWMGATLSAMFIQKRAWGITVGRYFYSKGTGLQVQVGTLLVIGWIGLQAARQSPMLRTLEQIPLLEEGQNPPPKEAGKIGLPFFYAVGSWPLTFDMQPVFYSLPYEMGPPTRFMGKIIARWKMPEIKLTIEGPKTPLPRLDATQWKNCLQSHWWSCPEARREFWSRHLDETRRKGARLWKAHWFQADDHPAAGGAAPEGVWIQAEFNHYIQERYVLVSQTGVHQTLILDRPKDADGQAASLLLKQTIQALRVTDSLEWGRSLAALRLSEVRLSDHSLSKNPAEAPFKIASAQGTLLARLSVNPADLDAYYHLGGTSLMLLKVLNQPGFKMPPHLTEEWKGSAYAMIQSALRYARDVETGSRQARMLQDMALEAEKLKE